MAIIRSNYQIQSALERIEGKHIQETSSYPADSAHALGYLLPTCPGCQFRAFSRWLEGKRDTYFVTAEETDRAEKYVREREEADKKHRKVNDW